MTSRDLKWPEVIRTWRHLPASHLEGDVEGRTLAYIVHFTSYKAVARSKRHSRDRKWHHVTSGDQQWPGSNAILQEIIWKELRWQKTHVNCTFQFLQGVARSRRESRDRNWQHVTLADRSDRKWCHLTGSQLEVDVESRKPTCP